MFKVLKIVICIIIFSTFRSNAQNVKSFSEAPDDFIKELGDFMSNIENKEEKIKTSKATDEL